MNISIRSRIMPGLATGGWRRSFFRSLAAKFVLLVVVFASVPLVLYSEFRQAEGEKRAVLTRSLESQGTLIGQALRIALEKGAGTPLEEARHTLADVRIDHLRVKLLFRPAGAPEGSFFLVAAAPPLSNEDLARERSDLVGSGILGRLDSTCRSEGSVALRFRNASGQEEVLSSITPVTMPGGCWVVVTSHSMADFIGSFLGRPYWQTPEVQVAALIYMVLAVLVLLVFGGLWASLGRFGRLAKAIRSGDSTSFSEQNSIPELAGVAEAFDRMVNSLRASAQSMRFAAEENAHAFKTPIATIAQAIEPVRRAVGEDIRGRRALQVIEKSLDRLDALVTAARRMEETVAELVDPPRQKIDLAALTNTILNSYGDSRLIANVQPCTVLAGEDLLETVLENILDNAISFSPPHGHILVTLRAKGGWAELMVEDHGPGIDPAVLGKIFERYVSHRPQSQEAQAGEQHFGIGLWIVRRNVEAIGGTITAENRDEGGLRMAIRLPCLPKK